MNEPFNTLRKMGLASFKSRLISSATLSTSFWISGSGMETANSLSLIFMVSMLRSVFYESWRKFSTFEPKGHYKARHFYQAARATPPVCPCENFLLPVQKLPGSRISSSGTDGVCTDDIGICTIAVAVCTNDNGGRSLLPHDAGFFPAWIKESARVAQENEKGGHAPCCASSLGNASCSLAYRPKANRLMPS